MTLSDLGPYLDKGSLLLAIAWLHVFVLPHVRELRVAFVELVAVQRTIAKKAGVSDEELAAARAAAQQAIPPAPEPDALGALVAAATRK